MRLIHSDRARPRLGGGHVESTIITLADWAHIAARFGAQYP